jgi:hypothetical protein
MKRRWSIDVAIGLKIQRLTSTYYTTTSNTLRKFLKENFRIKEAFTQSVQKTSLAIFI